ncbi:MAG: sulfatase [Acidobacteriota bacterium]|nr:MAG: sulfatase [Acidobacteriota bacterium]
MTRQLAAVLLLLLPTVACRSQASGAPRPIVLITIDTLRADHLGLYGGTGLATPHMDRIGREGAVVRTAYAPFGRTTQSVGTILTGLHPLRHGAFGLSHALPESVETVTERLRASGYATAAFVTNVHLRRGQGFEQGFSLFSNAPERWERDSAFAITREGLAWLSQRAADEPFFLWLHYLDPHWAYAPDPEWARRADTDWSGGFDLFERVRSRQLAKGEIIFSADEVLTAREIEHARRLYAAEVAQTDAAIGELVAGLEQLGLLERVILLLTADHGEALGDHRYWFAHGEMLYDDTLWVPLLIRAPGLVPAGTELIGTALLEDVAPTLLELATGQDARGPHDGQSLADELGAGGRVRLGERTALHLTDHDFLHDENPRRYLPGLEGRWWAIRQGDWKLIRVPRGEGLAPEEELYNLALDPKERDDRLAHEPQIAARLRRELDRQQASFGRVEAADEAEVDEQLLDALRRLGYLN